MKTEEEVRADIELITTNLKNFLWEKNHRYGNAALEVLGIFTKFISDDTKKLSAANLLVRLDDKLKRIINSKEMRKNDFVDLTGYLILLMVDQGWTKFDELLD